MTFTLKRLHQVCICNIAEYLLSDSKKETAKEIGRQSGVDEVFAGVLPGEKEKIIRHDGAVYCVSPWALTWDDENYYMIAFDGTSGKIKHYRVDKMLDISVAEDEREGREFFEDFDMAIYSKKTFGMFGGREETVKLRCKNRMANIIVDRFGTDTIMTVCDDEHFEITVKVAVSPVFLTWLMNFGSDIKIISPQSVIEDFKALAEECLKQY